jgi:4-carboxymuconolactone decarboxylase
LALLVVNRGASDGVDLPASGNPRRTCPRAAPTMSASTLLRIGLKQSIARQAVFTVEAGTTDHCAARCNAGVLPALPLLRRDARADRQRQSCGTANRPVTPRFYSGRFAVPPSVRHAAAPSYKEAIMDKVRFDKGLEVRTAVLGKDYVEASMKSADDFNRPFQELVTEYCWGAAWGSEGLSRKTRSMLNIAMISILNRPHELKLHVKGALRNGVTKDEIREVLVQVAIYAGVPCGVDAFRIAREAFKEVEAP